MKLRSLQITGEGDDASVLIGLTDSSGQQQSYTYPGRVHVAMTAHETGYLHLTIAVNPITRKKEMGEKNLPQQRFDT